MTPKYTLKSDQRPVQRQWGGTSLAVRVLNAWTDALRENLEHAFTPEVQEYGFPRNLLEGQARFLGAFVSAPVRIPHFMKYRPERSRSKYRR